MTTGMPLSMQVTSMPSIVSIDVAGRQQRATTGARDVEKLERDRRRRAGHAIDARVAFVLDRALRRGHVRHCDAAGVHHVNAHRRRRAGDRHEPVLDGPGPDTREDVAAVLAVADFGLVDDDLQEQIVDVGVRRASSAR